MEINRSYYQTPKPSFLMKLLWKAAGADKYLLERSTYSDQIKYMCMGGIIVATGVMAGLAGGYAFYTIFEPRGEIINQINTVAEIKNSAYSPTDIPTAIKATIFGIIWGLIIFNIDRFIVTSTGKGDGTEAITLSEFKTAIPRLLMGTIIALTISKPVEIRMFKSEIDIELVKRQQLLEKEYEINTRKNYSDRIADLELENTEIQKRIDGYLHKISTKDSLYNIEMTEGNGGRGEGEGPVALSLKSERIRLQAELDDYINSNKTKIDDIDNRRKKLYSDLEMELSKNKVIKSGLDGLLERIKIAHKISGVWISLFITLLFLAIELTPIFFKLMLIKGPYDYLEENIKELIKAEQAIEIQYNFYPDKEGVEKHNVINHQVEKVLKENVHLLKKQEEINKKAVDKWGENQNKKVDDNLADFISEEK